MSEWDTCICGDYRRDHKDGTGRCGLRWLKPDCGCNSFRIDRAFATQADAEAFYREAMAAPKPKPDVPPDPVFTSYADLVAWVMEDANMAAADKQLQLAALDQLKRVMLAHSHLFPVDGSA